MINTDNLRNILVDGLKFVKHSRKDVCPIPHLIDTSNEWYNLSIRIRRKDYGSDVQYRIQGRGM